MTTAYPKPTGTCPVVHGSPVDIDGTRVPLYSPEFAADPHRAYASMRQVYGALVPVELTPGVAATLVIDYRTALDILHDPEHFPADPRTWQKTVPAGCPIRPMMEWRPNALRNDGEHHTRFRRATVAAIDAVDLHALHATVEQVAIPLINTFSGDGQAELIGQYAFPITFDVLNAVIGCPDEIGTSLVGAFRDMFNAADPTASATVEQRIGAALGELIAYKRATPGDDIATRLLHHPAALTDDEIVHQLVTMYAAGSEPGLNLIVNTVLLMLTDDRFGGSLLGGSLSVRDALDEVLFNDPPLANYCISYPRQPVLIDGVWLPTHQPVLISMAACNTDPAVRSDDLTGNRAHLSWSAGNHTCPASTLAYLIAQDAIEQLLDALPEMRLRCSREQLTWRPGPFHRALTGLPVAFPAAPPLRIT